jgi:hypothetical protein
MSRLAAGPNRTPAGSIKKRFAPSIPDSMVPLMEDLPPVIRAMISWTLEGPRKSATWPCARLNWLKLSNRLPPIRVPTEAGMLYVPALKLTFPIPKLPSEETPAGLLAGERNAWMPAATVSVPLFSADAAALPLGPRGKTRATSLPRPRFSR